MGGPRSGVSSTPMGGMLSEGGAWHSMRFEKSFKFLYVTGEIGKLYQLSKRVNLLENVRAPL